MRARYSPAVHASLERQIGRYQILERLAVGGMAEVFLAQEADGLDRLVVVKKMLPALAEESSFVEMFLQEAKIAAGISHPNVVQILELGQADGLPFLVMEYVQGVTLKELIRAARAGGGALPLGVVLHLVAQACAGAHAAHELRLPNGDPAGLVHRDLTPHNLMVDTRGHVKLLDFGIAKAAGISGDFTRTGVLRGKVSYMSPEQTEQAPLDRRSDVFALGVCAYELFGLERPFAGGSDVQTLRRIQSGQAQPLRDRRPDLPPAVAAVVHRALATDREARFPSAEAFRVALRQAATEAGIDVDPDKAGRALRSLVGTLTASRVAAIDAAIARGRSAVPAPAPVRAQAAPAPTDRSSTRTGLTRTARRIAPLIAGAGVAIATVAFTLSVVGGVAAGAWWWSTGPSGPPLRIALAPVHARNTMIRDYEPLRAHLERETGRPVLLTVGASYEDTLHLVTDGEVPFAVLTSKLADQAVARDAGTAVLGYKVVDGATESQGYLLVPSSVPARKVSDLRGSTLCLTDPESATGWTLPVAFLAEQGLTIEADFDVHRSRNHEQVLRDLLAGTCQIGATYSGNLLTADQRGIPVQQLKILAITGATRNDAFLASSRTPADEVAAVRAALLSFDPATAGGVDGPSAERISRFAAP